MSKGMDDFGEIMELVVSDTSSLLCGCSLDDNTRENIKSILTLFRIHVANYLELNGKDAVAILFRRREERGMIKTVCVGCKGRDKKINELLTRIYEMKIDEFFSHRGRGVPNFKKV